MGRSATCSPNSALPEHETAFRANGVLLVSTVLALLFCVIVAYQNRQLARQLSDVGGALSGPARAVPGDRVPPFTAFNVRGEVRDIDYGPSAQYRVLFIFSPNCGVCEQQASHWWLHLHRDIDSNVAELIAVSLDGAEETQAALKQNGLDFDVLIMPDWAIRRAYRVTDIPQLLVVSPEGRVEWAQYGLLDQAGYADLVRFISDQQKRVIQQ